MASTIAERAARGEILHAPDLTRHEQAELLLWARAKDKPIPYEEIKKVYGYTQSTDTLRGWHREMVSDKPPPVAVFTAHDDWLLQNAVQLYATGPLDDENSFKGVWKKAKEYIKENGGTTTAGVFKLKQRWHELNGLPVPLSTRAKRRARARGASATDQAPAIIRTEPRVALARSFPNIAGQNHPTSTEPATGMYWEEYAPLSEGEMREALGSKYAVKENKEQHEQDDPDMEWEDYPSLSEGELREVLGSDFVGEEDKEQQHEQDDQEEQAKEEAGWEKYEPLSEGEMRQLLGNDYAGEDSASEDYPGEEEDGDEDSDYEEN